MPLKGTLGAIAEFKQGYARPLPVSNAVAVPASLGLGATITYTPNVNVGAVETYFANSNVGGYTGNSTSNTITIVNMLPFANYYFDVTATSIGGNSPPVSTNNVFVGCNVVANGNIAITGIPQCIAIEPSGLKVHLISGQRWYRYSRNPNTGQLSLDTSVAPPSRDTLSSIVISGDGKTAYISGDVTTNNFPYGTFPTTAIWQYSINNNAYIYQTTLNFNAGNICITPNWLMTTPDATKVYLLTDASPNPSNTAYQFSFVNLTRNTTTGNLSFVGLINLEAAAGKTYAIASTQITSVPPDSNSAYVLLQQSASGSKDIIALDRNGNAVSYAGTSVLRSNVLTTYTGMFTSTDSKTVYGFDSGTINALSRNSTTSVLTPISNVTAPNVRNGISNFDSVLFAGGNLLYDRNTTTGNLTLIGNSTSFSYPANSTMQTIISPDGKNIYTLQNNNIAIFNIYS